MISLVYVFIPTYYLATLDSENAEVFSQVCKRNFYKLVANSRRRVLKPFSPNTKNSVFKHLHKFYPKHSFM